MGKKGRITKKNGVWKRGEGGISEDTYCDIITLFCLFRSCEGCDL